MTHDEYAADLTARWAPSPWQIAAADKTLTGCYAYAAVYTAHVLVNKEWGVWTEDATVVPINMVFEPMGDPHGGRNLAMETAEKAAKEMARITGFPCTAGYTRHTPNGQWAVWEV